MLRFLITSLITVTLLSMCTLTVSVWILSKLIASLSSYRDITELEIWSCSSTFKYSNYIIIKMNAKRNKKFSIKHVSKVFPVNIKNLLFYDRAQWTLYKCIMCMW